MKIIDKRRYTPEGELREDYRGSEPAAKAGAEAESEGRPAEAAAPLSSSPATADRASSATRRPAPLTPPEAARDGSPVGAVGAAEPAPGQAPDFLELMEMFVQPVLLYLGDLSLPNGAPTENLPMARRQIDLLEILQEKTAGNLTSREASILEDLLYRLRLRYVQKTS